MNTIVRRTIATAAVFTVHLAASLTGVLVAPGSAEAPASVTTRVMSVPEAEVQVATQVEAKVAAKADPAACWETEAERAGRWPATALVKDDGGVVVRTVTADVAWDLSAAGKVWVLAWCE